MTAPARIAAARASFTRMFLGVLAALSLAVLAACSSGPGTRAEVLDRTLYDYSGAIRWNNFEVAYDLLDPEQRDKRPMTDLDWERLKQIQVTRYDVIAQAALPDGRIGREVEIALINRHTQAERVVRTREVWRYDEATQRWWQTEGLPDFSAQR